MFCISHYVPVLFSLLGAAHGLSGILFALLNFPAFIKSDASVERDVKAAVDYFLAIQAEDGNFATVVGEERSGRAGEGLVHWCHGAPGKRCHSSL